MIFMHKFSTTSKEFSHFFVSLSLPLFFPIVHVLTIFSLIFSVVSLVSYIEGLISNTKTLIDILPLAATWGFTTNSFYFYDMNSNINLASTLTALGLQADLWYGEHQWWALQLSNVLPRF